MDTYSYYLSNSGETLDKDVLTYSANNENIYAYAFIHSSSNAEKYVKIYIDNELVAQNIKTGYHNSVSTNYLGKVNGTIKIHIKGANISSYQSSANAGIIKVS